MTIVCPLHAHDQVAAQRGRRVDHSVVLASAHALELFAAEQYDSHEAAIPPGVACLKQVIALMGEAACAQYRFEEDSDRDIALLAAEQLRSGWLPDGWSHL